jgi:hypothetical protein
MVDFLEKTSFLENTSVLDFLNQDFLNIPGASVSVLASTKSFDEFVSCKSVLAGTFVRIDGVQFTASMSATGSGYNCSEAKENSETAIHETFNQFLETYTPKITQYTYTIETSCGGNCDGNSGSLEIKLNGVYEIVPIGIGSFYSTFYKAYPTTNITSKSFMQFGSDLNYIGPSTTITDPLGDVNLSIYNTSVEGAFSIGYATKKVTVELAEGSINNASLDAYSAEALSSGFDFNSSTPQTGTFSLQKDLLLDIYDGSTTQTFTTNQLEVTVQRTSVPVNGKGTANITIQATLFQV